MFRFFATRNINVYTTISYGIRALSVTVWSYRMSDRRITDQRSWNRLPQRNMCLLRHSARYLLSLSIVPVSYICSQQCRDSINTISSCRATLCGLPCPRRRVSRHQSPITRPTSIAFNSGSCCTCNLRKSPDHEAVKSHPEAERHVRLNKI